jgi:hypothetical protein
LFAEEAAPDGTSVVEETKTSDDSPASEPSEAPDEQSASDDQPEPEEKAPQRRGLLGGFRLGRTAKDEPKPDTDGSPKGIGGRKKGR